MPDANGNALRGEPGHWRFKKDVETSKKEHGTTSMKNLGVKLGIAEHPANKENKKSDKLKDRSFSKKGVKALNRKEQLLILRTRKVELTKPLKRCKEADLIDMILKSNPEVAADEEFDSEEVAEEPAGEVEEEDSEEVVEGDSEEVVEKPKEESAN